MSERLGIQCQCGTVKGRINQRAFQRHNHLICYCRDCQAFARHLGGDNTMDSNGGTEIVQVSCADVTITEGQDSLACIRLAEGGLVRWYASCCNTPVCNAPGVDLPFVGLIHTCLQPAQLVKDSFQPVSFIAFTGGATGDDKPKSRGMPLGLVRFLLLALGARFRGDGKRHPLFLQTGEPKVTPTVLNAAERALLYPVP